MAAAGHMWLLNTWNVANPNCDVSALNVQYTMNFKDLVQGKNVDY